jgi:phage terminase Nu1 subunit (DNA packaging protein)
MLPSEATTSDLAKLFGATVQHINDLARKGVVKRTAQGRFDLKESVRGWAKYKEQLILAKAGSPGTYAAAKTRRALADAQKAEIDLAEKLGKLVEAETTERVLSQLLGIIRQRLLALPSRIAPRIFRLNTATESEALLKHEIRTLLEYIAGLDAGHVITLATRGKTASGNGHAVQPSENPQ